MNRQLEEDAAAYRQRKAELALANAGRVGHSLVQGFTYGKLDARDARKKLQRAIIDLDATARASSLSADPNRLELRAQELRDADRWTQHKALQRLLDEAELVRSTV